MRKKLFMILLFAAFQGAFAATCTQASRICSETEPASGKCVRYTNTFLCETESPEKDRCAPSGPLEGCTVKEVHCLSTSPDGSCLETESSISCPYEPKGPGIAAGAPEITVKYSTRTVPDGIIPDGCRITESACLDTDPRKIPVDNVPGLLHTAAPPCWRESITISCPSEENAGSCGILESAGCRREEAPRCEETADGVCIRWSALYRCEKTPVEGDGILTEEEIIKPGTPVHDDSACVKARNDMISQGLTCTEISRRCAEKDPSERLPCLRTEILYECRGEGIDGCAALDGLKKVGRCAVLSDTGAGSTENPLREALFLCEEKVTQSDASPAEFLGREAVPDWTDDGRCLESPPAPKSLRAEKTDIGIFPKDCTRTSVLCSEGPGIRFVNGLPEYRECWAFTEEWLCRGEGMDECDRFEKDPACTLVSESCPENTGTDCPRPTRLYRCTKKGTSGIVGEVCDGQICIEGVCRPTDAEADQDFTNTLVQLEIARQAGVYGDITGNRFFSGTSASCKDRKGASSCCTAETVSNTNNSAFSVFMAYSVASGLEYIRALGSPYVYDLLSWSDSTSGLLTALYGDAGPSGFTPSFSYWGATAAWSSSGWTFEFSPTMFAASAAIHFADRYTSCGKEDVRTAMAKGQRLCHFVGTACVKSVAGLGCVETSERYVCFNSRLARIIHEEGRKQVGRNWGTPEMPDARGFTIEELQMLDFSAMDLSEFTADIIRETASTGKVSPEAARKRAAQRVAAMIKKELSPSAPVPGIKKKTAGKNQPDDPSGTGGTGSPSSRPL